jgi:predicted Zn-dependent protease
MNYMKKITTLLLVTFIGVSLYAQVQGQDPLLDILRSELKYQFTEMQQLEQPPYFMDFRVVDVTTRSVQTEFGAVTGIVNNRVRNFVPSVRVGCMEFDNQIEPHQTVFTRSGGHIVSLPLNDDPMAIKQIIWDECFHRHRRAIDDFERAVARRQLHVELEDRAPAFTEAPVVVHFEPLLTSDITDFDEEYWAERMKRISALFLKNPDIATGTANASFIHQRRYYLNSEGTEVVQNKTYARIAIRAMIRAEDGMELPLTASYFAFHQDGLPTDEEIMADVESIKTRLVALQNAPLVSPYTGPALLSGAASGVFFHEIFGHRIEGQKMKSDRDGQTFKRMVGQFVLPASLSVFDDPTMRQYLGQDLAGFYKFDDQGVRGERVVVVENGILRNFLMTRTPIDGFYRSTGHARADLGFDVDSRQSNLIIETSEPKSEEELRRLLIEEVIAQGREYGFYFRSVSGGFTMTSATATNSFAVNPLEVYRVWADGRPDEMVRGVDLIGTPLSMFAQITHAGKMDTAEIFTGTCVAGSGNVPVTAISPTILVRQIEMQRRPRATNRGPILSRP